MPQQNILGISLEVLHIAGDAALAPIVFLHEGLGSAAMWRDFPAQVCAATGRAGWVYSRRGYGQSASVPNVREASGESAGQRTGRLLPDYMHGEAWRVLPALLAACGIQKPVLLGHSDGASIALLYASRFDTSACIVMAPHLFVEDVSLRSIEAARQAYLHGDLRSRLEKYHADVDCAFWQWNDVWLSQGFRDFNIEADCAHISCPLLAIQGWDDPYGTMAQIDALTGSKNRILPIQGMRRQLSKLERCGHSPQRDQLPATLDLVQKFLAL